ncbi:MAG: arylsulfatase [Bacteroidota bacterium]
MKILSPGSFIARCMSALILLTVILSCTREQEKPSIILIVSDDQAWGDTGLSGNEILETPNLERITAEGAQLENFFVSPMCAPTRASLLTGRYNLRTGTSWVGRRSEFLGLEETTLADILKEEGYATGIFGKWHLGEYGPYHPNERGFDEFTGFSPGAANNYFRTRLEHNGKRFTSDNYITDVLTDSAMRFIAEHRDEPFFCYIPYNVPHHPFQVPDRYFDKYKKRGIEDNRTASVYGMVENMDENIGRILDQLQDLELEENTIVIFLSDNGPAFKRFNAGLAGLKAQVGEGSVKVPFYIMWENRIPEGTKFTELAAHIDLLPTLLDAAGIDVPDSLDIDGISLMPLLSGSGDAYPGRTIYTHQTRFGECLVTPGGLRTGHYRLQNWKKGYELYDMLKDPSQKLDIAFEKPELTQRLISDYEAWYEDVTAGGTNWPPVPVGYKTFDTIKIVAPDALKSAGINYSGKRGWATDWFCDWQNTSDSLTWQIDVWEAGRYEFILNYWCKKENTGSVFILDNGQTSTSNTLTIPNESPFHELPNKSPEGAPRERDWAQLSLGEMELATGEQELVLKALIIPGENAGEFRSLKIIRKY